MYRFHDKFILLMSPHLQSAEAPLYRLLRMSLSTHVKQLLIFISDEKHVLYLPKW